MGLCCFWFLTKCLKYDITFNVFKMNEFNRNAINVGVTVCLVVYY